jgi:hypothetical protein
MEGGETQTSSSDFENRETRNTKSDPSTVRVNVPGDAATLRPTTFEPYAPGNQAPHQGPNYGVYGTMPDMLRLGLLDARLRFFQEPIGTAGGPDPLVAVLQSWLGGEKPVSVLNFAGVPTGAADAAIGVILNPLSHPDRSTGPQATCRGPVTPCMA